VVFVIIKLIICSFGKCFGNNRSRFLYVKAMLLFNFEGVKVGGKNTKKRKKRPLYSVVSVE